MGRPSKYTPELADKICEMITTGSTLGQVSAAPGMPHVGTILRWVAEKEDFREIYARARDSAADLFESKIIEAAEMVTGETAQADRVKIDALKWVAARRAPRRYGDRVNQVMTGEDGKDLFGGLADAIAMMTRDETLDGDGQ